MTLRELLALTSGIGFGGLGSAVPTYERALAVAIKDEPGKRFTYGGIPLQVFGAVLARKLDPRELTPHAYLARAVARPDRPARRFLAHAERRHPAAPDRRVL